MRLSLPLFALLGFALLTTPTQAQAVSLPLTISDGAGGNRTLAFGVDPAATDGIDPALGEAELPPFPPTGAFEARFVDEDIPSSGLGNGSYRDYREGSATPEGIVVHEIRYQVGDGSSITLAWDLPPTVTGRLQDVITGAIVDVPMEGEGSFTVNNPGGLNKLKLTVTYTQPNTAPEADDDAATTDEDTPVNIDVLANDTDEDDDPLTVTAVSDPDNGTATVNDDGTVTYLPDADYNGGDALSYTVTDGAGGEATADVTVTITPVNDAPSASSITAPPDGSQLTVEGDGTTPVTVAWTPASDPESQTVSYRWEATLTEDDFSDPALSVETAETTLVTTFAALDAALDAGGIEQGDQATLFHRLTSSDGELSTVGPVATVTLVRGVVVPNEAGPLPTAFALGGGYPNPTPGSARIAVDLPWPADVTVEVYDVAGRRVATHKARLPAGQGRSLSLDGLHLGSGVYIYRLVADSPEGTDTAAGRFTVVR